MDVSLLPFFPEEADSEAVRGFFFFFPLHPRIREGSSPPFPPFFFFFFF